VTVGHRLPGRRQNQLPASVPGKRRKAQGTAVVVNEFGATGIDDRWCARAADEPCCWQRFACAASRAATLQQALRPHGDRARARRIARLQRIVIETSGSPIPRRSCKDLRARPALGEVFHIEAMVTVVDAETGGDLRSPGRRARRQGTWRPGWS